MIGLISLLGVKRIKLEVMGRYGFQGELFPLWDLLPTGSTDSVPWIFVEPRQCSFTRCAAGQPEASGWNSAAYCIRNCVVLLLVSLVL